MIVASAALALLAAACTREVEREPVPAETQDGVTPPGFSPDPTPTPAH